jgi:mannosyl-oligosaccharide alpha-1,2-mannosidase
MWLTEHRAFTSQPHRASNRVVLAELGSLSVEFTRLAQITKEPKYYDAIARITDALQEWQNHTRVPGLWPVYVDASGCERVQYRTASSQSDGSSTITNLSYSRQDSAGVAGQAVKNVHESADDSSTAGSHSGATIPNPAANAGVSGGSSSGTYVSGDSNAVTPSKTGDTGDSVLDRLEVHRIKGWDANHPESAKATDKTKKEDEDEVKMEPLHVPPPVVFDVKPGTSTSSEKSKRQLVAPATNWESSDVPAVNPPSRASQGTAKQTPIFSPTPLPECYPHGLSSTSSYGTEEFTLGSMADSTYEYLTKQYLLLQGQVEQYREMYESAVEVAKEKLLFRVMVPDESREIYVSGTYKVVGSGAIGDDDDETTPHFEGTLHTTGSHLTCFAGGMYALGAKVFSRPQDLAVAEKLTDGCFWAYESTTTGIMPESFHAVSCDGPLEGKCEWNETKWWEELDPAREWRESSWLRQMEIYRKAVAAREKQEAEEAASLAAAATQPAIADEDADGLVAIQTAPPEPRQPRSAAEEEAVPKHENRKRDAAPPAQPPAQNNPDIDPSFPRLSTNLAGSGSTPTTPTPPSRAAVTKPPIFSPSKPPSHEEYVRQRIERDKIPPGFSSIPDPRYILRPEALESMFYLYRITGDQKWREGAWKMISAILRTCETEFGYSAIDDVTKELGTASSGDADADGVEKGASGSKWDYNGGGSAKKGKGPVRLLDSMESFWLAETLKYAFLIFEEEGLWGFDEWVYNTEAHPFRRSEV